MKFEKVDNNLNLLYYYLNRIPYYIVNWNEEYREKEEYRESREKLMITIETKNILKISTKYRIKFKILVYVSMYTYMINGNEEYRESINETMMGFRMDFRNDGIN